MAAERLARMKAEAEAHDALLKTMGAFTGLAHATRRRVDERIPAGTHVYRDMVKAIESMPILQRPRRKPSEDAKAFDARAGADIMAQGPSVQTYRDKLESVRALTWIPPTCIPSSLDIAHVDQKRVWDATAPDTRVLLTIIALLVRRRRAGGGGGGGAPVAAAPGAPSDEDSGDDSDASSVTQPARERNQFDNFLGELESDREQMLASFARGHSTFTDRLPAIAKMVEGIFEATQHTDATEDQKARLSRTLGALKRDLGEHEWVATHIINSLGDGVSLDEAISRVIRETSVREQKATGKGAPDDEKRESAASAMQSSPGIEAKKKKWGEARDRALELIKPARAPHYDVAYAVGNAVATIQSILNGVLFDHERKALEKMRGEFVDATGKYKPVAMAVAEATDRRSDVEWEPVAKDAFDNMQA